jgi:hypothetical protein
VIDGIVVVVWVVVVIIDVGVVRINRGMTALTFVKSGNGREWVWFHGWQWGRSHGWH